MKTGFGTKLKEMSLAKRIALIALAAVVIAGIVVGAVLLAKNVAPKDVTLTFYNENRSGSEQITVPRGSTLGTERLPAFEKAGYYLAAWSYVKEPTEYLKATDTMDEDTEFIAIFLKEEELFESNRYLGNVSPSCEFTVSSTVALTDENLHQYIEFETLEGVKNSIRVVESGNGTYKLLSKNAYFPGDTYSIRIVDGEVAKFTFANGVDVTADNIRKYSFSIEDEEVYRVKFRSELISIPVAKLAGFEENIGPDGSLSGRALSVAYFDGDVALKADDVIRIVRGTLREDTFHKVRSVTKVEDKASKYYGKMAAVLSVPKTTEYLEDYEVKITGLDHEDVVSEDIISKDELVNIVYNELLSSEEYARAMDTLFYAAKQTETVQSVVDTLSDKEREEFFGASFRRLAATNPTVQDLNLKLELEEIGGNGWIGYKITASASPTIRIGQKAKLTTSLSTSMAIQFTQYSTSFYVDEDTGRKKDEYVLINSWEYTSSSIRSIFDAETTFKIVFELADAEEEGEGFDPNVDISEQVADLLDVILSEEEESGNGNGTARLLLDKYLEGLDYELINDDLDYVELFTVPIGQFTCNIYGIDITIGCDFVVSAGLRCGLSSSFTYHVEKLETTKNGKKTYNGYDLEEVDWNDIVYDEVGKDATSEEFAAASARLSKDIKYAKLNEYKKSTVLGESVSVDFTVGGKAGLRLGVRVSVKLSGFFMDWFMYIGADVELGAYTELTAYATYHFEDHLNGLTSQRLTGAAKLEVGFYIKFDVKWKFFWLECSYNIIEEQWPLFTLSTTPSIFDFNEKKEEMTVVGRQADLKVLLAGEDYKSLLELCYVDVFENSIVSSPIKAEDFDKLGYHLVDYKVTDPRDKSDVTARYDIRVSEEGFIRVWDDDLAMPRDTDVATITVYLSLPEKNFLTGSPVGKTLVVNMPLGEIIDLEHQYSVRFLDHLGNVLTDGRGKEFAFTLYGNEFPSEYPRMTTAQAYLDRVYGENVVHLRERSLGSGQDIWRDSDGNKIKVEKATRNIDYYLDESIKAYLVRYTYFDSAEKAFKHIDSYRILGETLPDPDIESLGKGGEFVTGWEIRGESLLGAENFRNYDVDGIAFEETYKTSPVETSFIYEVYARYDNKYTDIVFKFGDLEVARRRLQYGTRLGTPFATNGSLHYPTTIGFNQYSAGDMLSVPSNEYRYCYQNGKLYSLKLKDIEQIKNDAVIKELQTVGLWQDEYVIPFPATEVEFDKEVTVNVIARPRALYENLNQYITLLSTKVGLGEALTAERPELDNIKYGDRTLAVTVSDLTLPYVISNMDDERIHITEENGKAKISLDLYAETIMDVTADRIAYVTPNANGGRFGLLPNGGLFAQGSDLRVPAEEMFVSLEFGNAPSISYDRIVGDAEYAVPVKFGSRFVGWSTTPDGKSLIGKDTVLVPKVGDAAVVTLYAVFESDPIVELDLLGFERFTYNGTEHRYLGEKLYLVYANGVAPTLPSIEVHELSYLAGWAYGRYNEGDTVIASLPSRAPAADANGYISLMPVVKSRPRVRYRLSDALTFAEQTGFRYDNYNAVAWIAVGDTDSIAIPSVPTRELWSFSGWQIGGGAVLSDGELRNEIRRLIASGETVINVDAVYRAQSSAFRIVDADGGTFAEALREQYVVAVGTTFADSGIPVPSKAEYTFIGWRASETDTVYGPTDTVPQGRDIYSLTAVFRWDYANVILDANGGVFADEETVKTVKARLGEPMADASAPTRDGYYVFAGWARTENGTPFELDSFLCAEGLRLYAIWEARTPNTVTYTIGTSGVVFDEISGFAYEGGMTSATASISFDTANALPTLAANDEYTLLGWSTTDRSEDILAAEQLDDYLRDKARAYSDVTLYAIFKKNYTNVTFNAEGGSFDGLNDTVRVSARVGERLETAPSPVRIGYSHVGWSLSVGGTAVDMEVYLCTENAVLYALWEAKAEKSVSYSIGAVPTTFTETTGFDYADGMKTATAVIGFEGVNALPSIAEHREYAFLGWSTTADGGDIIDAAELDGYLKAEADAGRDVTLYAAFKAYPRLTFRLSDGKVFAAEVGFGYADGNATAWTPVGDIDSSPLPNVPQNALQRFAGWRFEGGSTLDASALREEVKRLILGGATELEVYAVYEYHSAAFRIASLDGGQLDATPSESYIVAYGTSFGASGIPVPWRNEYTFLGWKLSQDGMAIYSLSDAIPEDASDYALYAVFKWDYENVVFEDASSTASVKYRLGDLMTGVPVPTREGYIFSGWSLTADGAAVNMSTLACREGLKLYALWTVKPPKTVTYMLGTESTFTVQSGFSYSEDMKGATADILTEGVNVLPAVTENEAFGLVGWSVTGEEGDIVSNIDEYLKSCAEADEAVILYAVWRAYPRLSFHLSDGKVFATESGFGYANGNATAWVSVGNADSIPIPTVPQDALQSFVGWRLGSDERLDDTALRAAVKALLQNGEDVEVYAEYEAHSSAFTIADLDGGLLGVTPSERYIVAHGTLFGASGIPVPTKAEHSFLGWRLSQDGTAIYSLSDAIPEELSQYELYAVFKWEYENVTFDANGGEYSDGLTEKTVKTRLGELVSGAPTPVRGGCFAFVGWSRTAGGAILDMSEVYCTEGLVLYAVWEDRSPRTVYLDAGNGRFDSGFGRTEVEIGYPYAFASALEPTYLGSGAYGFAYWMKADGTEVDGSYTVSDGEVFTAYYRRTDIRIKFTPVVHQYNTSSGAADVNLGEVTFANADEYGELEVTADGRGVFTLPTCGFDVAIPEGYGLVYAVHTEALTEGGIGRLRAAGAQLYLDRHDLAILSLPVSLTTDMLNVADESYTTVIGVFVVPTAGPDERVRFDNSLYYDNVGYGIIDSDYSSYITYSYGNGVYEGEAYCSVELGLNGNIVIPTFTIAQLPQSGQVSMVMIGGEYLTEAGIAAMNAVGARVYSLDGNETYYEVRSDMTLTRDMLKIELSPKFIVAYVPEDGTGLCAAWLAKVPYVEQSPNYVTGDYYYSVDYSGNGVATSYCYQLAFGTNGALVLPEYTVYRSETEPAEEYVVPEGKRAVFLIDSEDLTDSAIAMLEASGAERYTVEGGGEVYYEVNIALTQSMVKVGVAPNMCLAYVSEGQAD